MTTKPKAIYGTHYLHYQNYCVICLLLYHYFKFDYFFDDFLKVDTLNQLFSSVTIYHFNYFLIFFMNFEVVVSSLLTTHH